MIVYLKRLIALAILAAIVCWLKSAHIPWVVFFEYLRDNRVAISLYASVFFTAIVVTMPEDPPQTFKDCWTWTRNALSKHFNLVPKPTSTLTEAVSVTTEKTVDPAKDAVPGPKA